MRTSKCTESQIIATLEQANGWITGSLRAQTYWPLPVVMARNVYSPARARIPKWRTKLPESSTFSID